MKSITTGVGLGVLLSLCIGGGLAFGLDREDYAARMSQAKAAMKTDMNEALRQYLETRALYAGVEIDFGLGRAYQRMYQCADAKAYYTRVMVEYDLPESHTVYQRAVSAFDEISACENWQKVTLECDIPLGGYVMIDDDRYTSCWDRPFQMPDGEHTLKVAGPDGREEVKKITVKSGDAPTKIRLALSPNEPKVKEVEIERSYEVRERFSPALYWGLIAGGAAIAGIGGAFGAFANDARVDEQKWADNMSVVGEKSSLYAGYKKKRDDANDKVKLNQTLMYSFIGVGGAAIITGAALAIVSAVSGKDRVDDNPVSTYVVPADGGLSMGLGFTF